eukprot:gene4961-6304_t
MSERGIQIDGTVAEKKTDACDNAEVMPAIDVAGPSTVLPSALGATNPPPPPHVAAAAAGGGVGRKDGNALSFNVAIHNVAGHNIPVKGRASNSKELIELINRHLTPSQQAHLKAYWDTAGGQRGTPVISWQQRHDQRYFNPIDVGVDKLLLLQSNDGGEATPLPDSIYEATTLWLGWRVCGVEVDGCKCYMLLQRGNKYAQNAYKMV